MDETQSCEDGHVVGLEGEHRLAQEVDETQNCEDDQVVAIPNTNFKFSCFFSRIYMHYIVAI